MWQKGYTLIELMVVISIMAILSIVVYANFKNFGQDAVLNKAAGQVQTALRVAQSNATSGLKCPPGPTGQGGASWLAQFQTNRVDIYCDKQPLVVQKSYPLENATITSIAGSGSGCTQQPVLPITINYSALYGLLTFSGTDCTTLTLTLTNSLTGGRKTFNLSQGGATDVQ